MEYRFVRLTDNDDYVQIFDEGSSELIGSVLKQRHFLFSKKYILRFGETTYSMAQGLLGRRTWKMDNARLKFKLFGHNSILSTTEGEFEAEGMKRNKLEMKTGNGRTTFSIDRDALKSDDMVLVEDYDRLSTPVFFLTVINLLDHYQLW